MHFICCLLCNHVRCMCRLQEQAREEVWKRPSSARSDMPAPDGKPWQATTYTTYLSKEEEVGTSKRPAVSPMAHQSFS